MTVLEKDQIKQQQEIVRLSPITISRIAAGEVVERPASVIKELLENSLDAQATEIIIRVEKGGKEAISVSDNGCGMDPKNLSLAVESHTTSKLMGDDLVNIRHLGFRGEAVASIGAISRLTIKSRPSHLTEGASITVLGGKKLELAPAPHHVGTTVEIRDLFYATPARLKFLRAEKTENQYLTNIINKIAIAYPKVAFKLYLDGKLSLSYSNSDLIDSRASRVSEVIGKDFLENSIEISQSNGETRLSGYICLPTYARSNYTEQYLYINNRSVRDKLLLIYIKNAYQDFIGTDKYPITALFLDVPPELVDVNAHPAKTEVRFRDVFFIKSFIINALKRSLEENSTRTSSTIGTSALHMIASREEQKTLSSSFGEERKICSFPSSASYVEKPPMQLHEPVQLFNFPAETSIRPFNDAEQFKEQGELISEVGPFGRPKAQVHNTYIISQTQDGVMVIDQHAAHERICYEKLKAQVHGGNVESQQLLFPEIIELDSLDIQEKLLSMASKLQKSGLKIEYHAKKSIKITEVPYLLKACNLKELMSKVVNNILDLEDDANIETFINKIISTYACHVSIRAGHEMSHGAMESLLKEMENTKSIGQCNHGRPTHIELKLKDIKKLFERS